MMDRIISLVEQVRGEFGGRTIFQTAENSGAAVWLRELGSLKGFYLFENNRRYIIINKSLDKLLQQTVCAHEFGHDMLHRELSAGYAKARCFWRPTRRSARRISSRRRYSLPIRKRSL